MNKIVLVDKPAGWTSFDVVAKIRGAIRAGYTKKGMKPTKRQLKVGHAGTLDPFATGLLIVLLGDACSRSDEFLKQDKVYETTLELGKISSTGDPDGDITVFSDRVPSEPQVVDVLERFMGDIEQVPPAYSAIKVNGERAYRLARKGKPVEIPPRKVTIFDMTLVSYAYPMLTFRAHVSSGTYIRTLGEDIGKALGTGAYCKTLQRTHIGNMQLSDALTVEAALSEAELD